MNNIKLVASNPYPHKKRLDHFRTMENNPALYTAFINLVQSLECEWYDLNSSTRLLREYDHLLDNCKLSWARKNSKSFIQEIQFYEEQERSKEIRRLALANEEANEDKQEKERLVGYLLLNINDPLQPYIATMRSFIATSQRQAGHAVSFIPQALDEIERYGHELMDVHFNPIIGKMLGHEDIRGGTILNNLENAGLATHIDSSFPTETSPHNAPNRITRVRLQDRNAIEAVIKATPGINRPIPA